MKTHLLTLGLLALPFAAHAGIETYSTTASSNNSAAPNGWPTGMNPSDVKLTGRQMMADTRSWYEDSQWFDLGYTPTWLSGTSFKVSASTPSVYHVNRRIRTLDNSGYTYGTISAVAYGSGNVSVTVVPDSGSIASSLSRVWIGAVGAISSSVTSSTLGLSVLDNIVSGTTKVSVNSATSTISFTTAGVVSSYLDSAGRLVTPGVSTTGPISATSVSATSISGTQIDAVTLNATTAVTNLVSSTAGGKVSATYVYTNYISATSGIAFGTFSQSSDLSISSAASVNLSHGCGAVPRMAWAELINQSAELGYTAGMTAQVPPYAAQGANLLYAIGSDSTSTTLRIGSAGAPFSIINLGSGASSGITNGNWKIRLKTAC